MTIGIDDDFGNSDDDPIVHVEVIDDIPGPLRPIERAFHRKAGVWVGLAVVLSVVAAALAVGAARRLQAVERRVTNLEVYA